MTHEEIKEMEERLAKLNELTPKLHELYKQLWREKLDIKAKLRREQIYQQRRRAS